MPLVYAADVVGQNAGTRLEWVVDSDFRFFPTMPDDVFGEKACAFVITKEGQSLEFAELIAFLRQQNIASFKLPERLELVSEFPVSPVGKILKRQLREAIAQKVQREQAGGAVA